jgi:hypothetical protein
LFEIEDLRIVSGGELGLVQKRLLLGNIGKRNPPLIFQEGKDFAERMSGT